MDTKVGKQKIQLKIRAFALLLPFLLFGGCKKKHGGDQLPELFLLDGLSTSYTIRGSVAGLLGSNFQLNATGTEAPRSVTISSPTTAFSFPKVYKSFDLYSIGIAAYPTLPTQLCTLQNGAGQIYGSDITNVQVACVKAYLITGSVTGLTGSGLQLLNTFNTTMDPLPVTDPLNISPADPNTFPNFKFFKPVEPGKTYSVTVGTQPTHPWQTCNFGGALNVGGPVNTADVILPTLNCTTNNYTLGVSIAGLQFGGMQLSLNGGAPVSIAAGTTSYSFGSFASGTAYNITIASQPVGQNCSVVGNTGTIGGGNVTVSIGCTLTGYAAGGSVTGLSGTGLTLTMTGSVPQSVSVATGSTGYFFPTALNINNTYSVAITANPTSPWQTCTFPGGVTSVGGTVNGVFTLPQITCTTNTYGVGVTFNGLLNTAGLTFSLDGAAAQVVPSGSTSITLGTVPSGTSHTIRISSAPNTPYQICSFVGGANPTPVTVTNASVFVQLLCSPGPITGPAETARGSAITYSITPVPGATGYTWTVPANVTITGGQGTTAITVAMDPNCNAYGSITVTATYAAGTSAPATYWIGNSLLINGSGSYGNMTSWQLLLNGTAGVNDWSPVVTANDSFFRTSYTMLSKSQTVDLVANGYTAVQLDASPTIKVGERFYSIGWAIKYYLRVELRNAAGTPLATWNRGTVSTPIVSAAAAGDYPEVFTFTGYPKGVRFIYWEDGGMDTLWWAGYYGAFLHNAYIQIGNACSVPY